MMEKLRNPKNVKTISLIVAAIFVIGCRYRSGQLSGSGLPVPPVGTDSERYAESDC